MAIIEQYSTRITIQGIEGQNVGAATDMGAKRGKAFVRNIKSALKQLVKTGTGRALVAEIEANPGGHDLVIFCSGIHSPCAQANPNGIQSEVNWSIQPLRPFHKNVPLAFRTNISADTGLKVGMQKQIKDRLADPAQGIVGGVVTWAQCGANLDALLTRIGGGVPPNPAALTKGRNFAARLVGESVAALTAMGQGTAKMSDDTYIKLCFFFYDKLAPGIGVSSQVRIAEAVKMHAADGSYNPKTDCEAAPPAVVVGHELIHAWRMMNGRRCVRNGWEEEAMTTGLAMARGWRLTENRLREELKLPNRKKYDFPMIDGNATSVFTKHLVTQTKAEAEA